MHVGAQALKSGHSRHSTRGASKEQAVMYKVTYTCWAPATVINFHTNFFFSKYSFRNLKLRRCITNAIICTHIVETVVNLRKNETKQKCSSHLYLTLLLNFYTKIIQISCSYGSLLLHTEILQLYSYYVW